MSDFKTQAVRTDAPVDKWDQAKSTGAFLGKEDNFHIATLLEFRDDGDLADLLTNPERVSEVVQPGDNLLQIFNRIGGLAKDRQPDLVGQAASILGLGGSGPVGVGMFRYDND